MDCAQITANEGCCFSAKLQPFSQNCIVTEHLADSNGHRFWTIFIENHHRLEIV